MIADLGGPEGLSEAERQVCRRGACLAVACERLEELICNGTSSAAEAAFMTAAGGQPFQNQPNPYNSACSPSDPATPHASAMMVLLGDASVRSVTPSISPDTWNKACLPMDGNPLGPDW